MRGYINLLGLSHFFSGIFPTLSPIVVISLFDSALPSKSVYSVVILALIAIYLVLAEWLITSNIQRQIDHFVQQVKGSELTLVSKSVVVSMSKGHYWSAGAIVWTLITLGALIFFIPFAGALLSIVCMIAGFVGFFGGSERLGVITKVMPLLVLYFVAYLVIEGEATFGALFAVMYLSARSVQNAGSLGVSLGFLRLITQTPDTLQEQYLLYQKAYPFPNKKPLGLLIFSAFLVVSLVSILEVSLDRALSSAGVSVSQYSNLEIKAPRTGKIEYVYVKEGDTVFQGQVLSRISTQGEEQLSLLDAQIKEITDIRASSLILLDETLASRRDTLKNRKSQKEKGVGSTNEVLLAREALTDAELKKATTLFDLDSKLASLKDKAFEIQREIELSRITSPVAGEIQQETPVSTGSTVSQGDLVFTVVPEERVIVEVSFPFIQKSFLYPGQEVILQQPVLGNRIPEEVEAHIHRISPVLDSEEGEQTVSVIVQANQKIKTGQSYQVIIPLERMKVRTWLTLSLKHYVGSSLF